MTLEEIKSALELATDSVCLLQEELKSFFKAIPDPFYVIDREGLYLEVLGGNAHQLCLDGRTLKGQNIKEVFTERLRDLFLSTIRESIEKDSLVVVEYKFSASDFKQIVGDATDVSEWFEGRVYPIKDKMGCTVAVVWLALNITGKKLLEIELKKMAETDPLTGVFNRRYFYQFFEQEFASSKRYGKPLSFLLLDIDNFKHVNDAFGHHVGDQVLKELAFICLPALRDVDLLARFGGEEFVILLPNTPSDGAVVIAERLREAIYKNRLNVKEGEISVSVSIGVSEMSINDMNTDDVFKKADTALYEAKRNGKNRVYLSAS